MKSVRVICSVGAVFGGLVWSGAAFGQSSPTLFDLVFNVGDVAPGSMFDITDGDIPGTLTSVSQIGNTSPIPNGVLIIPGFVIGDTLGSSSQLNLFDGGEALDGIAIGLLDGTGSDSEFNMFGGVAGDLYQVNAGGTFNVAGGTLGRFLEVNAGGTVNISGGVVGREIRVNSGGTLTMSGGNVGPRVNARSGSSVVVSGGVVGNFFGASSGSSVDIFGGAFELNGAPGADISAGFGLGFESEVLTGVLADGSVFIFGDGAGDRFEAGAVTLNEVSVAPSSNPGTLSAGSFGKGVRSGESLTVTGSGELGENFAVVGGSLNIEGGTVGEGLEVAFGEVNVSGGVVGLDFRAHSGSVVRISGGTVNGLLLALSGSVVDVSGGVVGDDFRSFKGSVVNIQGGVVGNDFTAVRDNTVNISGGVVGDSFAAGPGSVVNISGGVVGDGFVAGDDSTINLIGTEFFLDGVQLSDLVIGEGFTIADRDVSLTGVLADGTAFDFDLNRFRIPGEDQFTTQADVIVTLIPAPGTVLMLGFMGSFVSRRRRD